MRTLSALFCLSLTAFLGCSSTGSDANRSTSGTESRTESAKAANATNAKPRKIGVEGDAVPESVRAIEAMIDQNGVILADEAEISVSKNYQLEVSLTGDEVSKDTDDSGALEQTATGKPMAWIRNLQIRADQKITVRIADVGTRPYIKILAKGNCSHLATVADGTPDVHHASGILIENADLRYIQETPTERVASVKPTEKTLRPRDRGRPGR